MKKIINKFVAITALSLVTTFAQATLIDSSIEIVHDYGDGKYSPNNIQSGNNCKDKLYADSVRIYDSNNSGCARFYDFFDFSAANFISIDSLELTLNFESATSWYENWDVRPGASASLNSGYTRDHDKDITTNMITFNASNLDSTVFQNMLSNESFSLMFSETYWGSNSFYLNDATLKINGKVQPAPAIQEVPEPAPLVLFSLSLLALGLVKQRKK